MLLETHRDDVREGGPQAPTRRPCGMLPETHRNDVPEGETAGGRGFRKTGRD